MSFQTGLSGLNASSRNLDVIGNNIANANTTGMKASRTEFNDLVAASLGAAKSVNAGLGVMVSAVSQQFSQGSISSTGNNLDVAINGGGFFQLKQPDDSLAYTRDGSFKLDKDGFLKTNGDANVMGYPTDATGKATSSTLEKLQLPTGAPLDASPTTTIKAAFNLDARAQAATATTPRSTYSTSLNVYDAEGVASPVNLYFEKSSVANTWSIFGGMTSTAPVGTLTFDASGAIIGPTAIAPATGMGITIPGGTIDSLNPNETTGIDPLDPSVKPKIPQPLTIDFSKVTQFGTGFAVSDLTQDGYTAGDLTGMSIGDDGVISARYSNGQTQSKGKLVLADFRNAQGLIPLGGNTWSATMASGEAVQGLPGVGKLGALRSGALEDSNVDLTSELVNMMTAQRAYQANAQTIKTQDQVISTLVNLR